MRVTSILRSANSLAASAASRALNEPVRIEPAKTRILGLGIDAGLPLGPGQQPTLSRRHSGAPTGRASGAPNGRLRAAEANPECPPPHPPPLAGEGREGLWLRLPGSFASLRTRKDEDACLTRNAKPGGRPTP